MTSTTTPSARQMRLRYSLKNDSLTFTSYQRTCNSSVIENYYTEGHQPEHQPACHTASRYKGNIACQSPRSPCRPCPAAWGWCRT